MVFITVVFAFFVYLMIARPQIVPASETFGSFWIKIISLLLPALAIAASTLASANNALEQRHLKFMENYP